MKHKHTAVLKNNTPKLIFYPINMSRLSYKACYYLNFPPFKVILVLQTKYGNIECTNCRRNHITNDGRHEAKKFQKKLIQLPIF